MNAIWEREDKKDSKTVNLYGRAHRIPLPKKQERGQVLKGRQKEFSLENIKSDVPTAYPSRVFKKIIRKFYLELWRSEITCHNTHIRKIHQETLVQRDKMIES